MNVVGNKLPFLLRALVPGEALFSFIGIFGTSFAGFPPPLQEYLDAQWNQPIDFTLIAQAAASLGSILGLVGLWRFQPWGRIVYTASTLGFYSVFVFDQPVVSSALGLIFQDFSTMCSGGTLTLVWTVPFPQAFLQYLQHKNWRKVSPSQHSYT